MENENQIIDAEIIGGEVAVVSDVQIQEGHMVEEFSKIIPDQVTDEQFDSLMEQTARIQITFGTHEKAFQLWNGMLYGALTTNKQKSEFRKNTKIAERTLREYAQIVRKYRNGATAPFLDKYPLKKLLIVSQLPDEERDKMLEKGKNYNREHLRAVVATKIREAQPPKTDAEVIEKDAQLLVKALQNVVKRSASMANRIQANEKHKQILIDAGISKAFEDAVTMLVSSMAQFKKQEPKKRIGVAK